MREARYRSSQQGSEYPFLKNIKDKPEDKVQTHDFNLVQNRVDALRNWIKFKLGIPRNDNQMMCIDSKIQSAPDLVEAIRKRLEEIEMEYPSMTQRIGKIKGMLPVGGERFRSKGSQWDKFITDNLAPFLGQSNKKQRVGTGGNQSEEIESEERRILELRKVVKDLEATEQAKRSEIAILERSINELEAAEQAKKSEVASLESHINELRRSVEESEKASAAARLREMRNGPTL